MNTLSRSAVFVKNSGFIILNYQTIQPDLAGLDIRRRWQLNYSIGSQILCSRHGAGLLLDLRTVSLLTEPGNGPELPGYDTLLLEFGVSQDHGSTDSPGIFESEFLHERR